MALSIRDRTLGGQHFQEPMDTGLRVLVVHNRYRSHMPSGENQAVDTDIALLRDAGVEVESYLRSSDEIADFGFRRRVGLVARPLYSPEDCRGVAEAIDRFRPSVVHLHNPFPLLSPAVVRVAKSKGVPVVQTVYNFRHVCAAGTFFRDGHVCEQCCDRRFGWPAIVHGCYRESIGQSVVMATAVAAHLRTWQMIDRLVPVSEFVAGHLRRAGFPPTQLRVRPNPVPDPGPASEPGRGFLYGGRLTEEKGVDVLLDAWARSGLGHETTLTIAGDGPQRPLVEAAVQEMAGVEYRGSVARAKMEALRRAASIVVVPSQWYEGLPLVALEALAAGRPVVASNLGALGELVDDQVGWSRAPDATSLAAALLEAHQCRDLAARSRYARRRFEERYSPRASLDALLAVYAEL